MSYYLKYGILVIHTPNIVCKLTTGSDINIVALRRDWLR